MSPMVLKMQGIITCFLTLLVVKYSLGQGSNQPYQPECDSWDQVVSAIRTSVSSYNGARVGECDKLPDCTGMKCTVTALGKTVEIDAKLFHCDDPPQMRILVAGNGVSFEETITHGSTYTIPGLTYAPLPFTPPLNIQMVVQFQQQPDGIVVGAKLKAQGAPIEFPLFSDILIRTPLCTTSDPLMMDCTAMEEFVASITPPPSCSKMITCDGISCMQRYGSLRTPLGTINIDVDSDLVVDSCSTPISIILKARSSQLNLDWTHTFFHSESVPVDQDLAYGATLVVNVTMIPLHDLEHIRTTIKYTITQALVGTATEYVLENALVPIPQCRERPTSPTTVEPNTDECASWKDVENALEFSLEGGYSVSDCYTLPGCRGYNCTATFSSDVYTIVVEEFHCQDPIYITVSIDGANEHYSQNFTHNDTVSIPDANGAELLVHIVQESPTEIFVGVYILYPGPGGDVIRFPLVSDQLLEVTPCDGVTVPSSTLKNNQGKPTKLSGDNKPVKRPVSIPDIGIAWTIILAIITAVVLAVIASAIFMFYRHRRQARDTDMLMENTDSITHLGATPGWSAQVV